MNYMIQRKLLSTETSFQNKTVTKAQQEFIVKISNTSNSTWLKFVQMQEKIISNYTVIF